MTKKEFLARLRKTRGKWDASQGPLRMVSPKGDRSCPVCAVAYMRGSDWRAAARRLRMAPRLADDIALAADWHPVYPEYIFEHVVQLRKELLAATVERG